MSWDRMVLWARAVLLVPEFMNLEIGSGKSLWVFCLFDKVRWKKTPSWRLLEARHLPVKLTERHLEALWAKSTLHPQGELASLPVTVITDNLAEESMLQAFPPLPMGQHEHCRKTVQQNLGANIRSFPLPSLLYKEGNRIWSWNLHCLLIWGL